MANRALLELQAASLNINAATYPNDSNLLERVRFAQRALVGAAGTATTLTPSASAVQATTPGANV